MFNDIAWKTSNIRWYIRSIFFHDFANLDPCFEIYYIIICVSFIILWIEFSYPMPKHVGAIFLKKRCIMSTGNERGNLIEDNSNKILFSLIPKFFFIK